VKRHPNSNQRLLEPVLVLALVLVDRCRWLYYISLVTFMLYVFCSCVVLFRLVLVLLAASIMAHSATFPAHWRRRRRRGRQIAAAIIVLTANRRRRSAT
jgi:hypothetical protein